MSDPTELERLREENLALRSGIDGVDQRGVHDLKMEIIRLEYELKSVSTDVAWMRARFKVHTRVIEHLLEALRSTMITEVK